MILTRRERRRALRRALILDIADHWQRRYSDECSHFIGTDLDSPESQRAIQLFRARWPIVRACGYVTPKPAPLSEQSTRRFREILLTTRHPMPNLPT